MKKQSGFTLIELVVVIIILGILAVTAVPKFIDLQSDARKSAMQGILGGVKGASNLAHAKFLVSPAASAAIEGITVNFVNGYPEAEKVCELVDLQNADGTDISTDNITCTEAAAKVTIHDTGAQDDGTDASAKKCRIVYNEAASNAAPTITVDAADC
ncbi:type II secretion system protein [Gallaecimonas sp. GXIMD4217]|uniref:type II secretion system protein n=1 Tax=Gallaecimonas sp. GXIMD4217 TaxID=3131927 RepID=UPI00311AEDFF